MVKPAKIIKKIIEWFALIVITLMIAIIELVRAILYVLKEDC